MPDLSQALIADLTERLSSYLGSREGYGAPRFLRAGGSAAVFKVTGPDGPRAIKVFNPTFLNGDAGLAERRRLDVQRRLIGHTCETLVQTYAIEEAQDTAFIEMEFVEWPSLKDELSGVPDSSVGKLISQLVAAVKFLESKGVVHRDIKPENIHISTDYNRLKLLDLGVARDFESPDVADLALTDYGQKRPFLATAQYSSPEYLYRLDEPTARLWHGLNIYQVGAVLHDLIMKAPIFDDEMRLSNRWLVARAVLTKVPTFPPQEVKRLSSLKSLASRCLVKDLDSRLNLVSWDDFDTPKNALASLRARLTRGAPSAGLQAAAAANARLAFDRNAFTARLLDNVRAELISICGPKLPLTAQRGDSGSSIEFIFSPGTSKNVRCRIRAEWNTGLYERSADLYLEGELIGVDSPGCLSETFLPRRLVAVGSIDIAEHEVVRSLVEVLSQAINEGLDLVEAL